MIKHKILIIGGGLSAIYAYYGCLDSGYEPEEILISTSSTSSMMGAVFMYKSPIPFTPVVVISKLLGTPQQYAKNQWRDSRVKTSAIERFKNYNQVTERLFDPYILAPFLWSKIPNIINFGYMPDHEIDYICKDYEAVICTFPRAEIWESAKRNNFVTYIPVYFAPCEQSPYIVTYNGSTDHIWVRKTTYPDKIFIEYRNGMDPEIARDISNREENLMGDVYMVSDITPNSPSISLIMRSTENQLRVGRSAALKPGYLSYEARTETKIFLRNLKRKNDY